MPICKFNLGTFRSPRNGKLFQIGMHLALNFITTHSRQIIHESSVLKMYGAQVCGVKLDIVTMFPGHTCIHELG